MWASAVTPIQIPHTIDRGSVLLPNFTEASGDVGPQDFENGLVLSRCRSNPTLGGVSKCPVPYFQNALLNTAREATTLNGALRNHSKLDTPSWTYQGRSYGVGGSVGLGSVRKIPVDFHLTGYSFEEDGYNASAHCYYASYSNLTIQHKKNQGSLGIFRLQGTVPNVFPDPQDPMIAWCDKPCKDTTRSAMFAWVAGNDRQGQHVVAIAATAWYRNDFSNLTCSLEFHPTKFTVSVNATNTSITVTSNDNTTTGPDPKGHLVRDTIRSLHFLSRLSPSLYISVMGDAFQSNANSIQMRFPTMARPEAVLRATEDSFEAILDDILSIYGGGQIGIANAITNTTIKGTFNSFRLGKPLVHDLTLLVNLVIVSGIVFESIRTKCWRNLPKYDIADFKSTVTAASFGGTAISKKIQQQYRDEHKNKKWTADSADRKLGNLAVCLRQDEFEAPRIILQLDKGLLMQDEAEEDGTEMEDGTASLETDSFKGATTAWGPIGQHNE